MRKFFYAVFRFFVGVYIALAVPLSIISLYTGLTQNRYWPVVIGAAMLFLHFKACSWLGLGD